ncbi:glycosyltransferase family 2 protein [Ichthyenterobacterium magnum]|uniref:Glycosyltransferase involved in cell wall biosynthesis n=1 Tax=Ichthyenterobacterium magnum TaxID=1230530 RepID=A0A420DUY5_9FLAO|nr:glycosyltransferase [Ichthyenterobacterium magnum]RKE97993.1 glycosyltransferase involved in cell wall biosynthesis [Ichthyenterobacterium magnum]
MNKFESSLTVAIWMVTYNHEAYIKQAIESVLMQKTNFNYKLFIGEDCSTDKTAEICKQLKKRYPDKIYLILNQKNLGPSKNAKQIYDLCLKSDAKYIAMLEGDDYWTDPLKLQKQIDFLKKNDSFSGSFHNTMSTNESDVNTSFVPWRVYNKEVYNLDDTISKIALFHTSSFVFRKNVEFIPDWVLKVQSGDMALFAIIASKGSLHRIDEYMSVYRKNEKGITNHITKKAYHKSRIVLQLHFKENFNVSVHQKIDDIIRFHTLELNKLSNSTYKKLKNLFKF